MWKLSAQCTECPYFSVEIHSVGLWNSFKKSSISVTTKPAQTNTTDKAAINGFAKKITTNPVSDKLSPQEEKAAFFPFPGEQLVRDST